MGRTIAGDKSIPGLIFLVGKIPGYDQPVVGIHKIQRDMEYSKTDL